MAVDICNACMHSHSVKIKMTNRLDITASCCLPLSWSSLTSIYKQSSASCGSAAVTDPVWDGIHPASGFGVHLPGHEAHVICHGEKAAFGAPELLPFFEAFVLPSQLFAIGEAESSAKSLVRELSYPLHRPVVPH